MLSIHNYQKLPLILFSAFCIFNFPKSNFQTISLKANYPMPPGQLQANYNPYPQQQMQAMPMDQANYQMQQMQGNGMPAPMLAPTMYPPYPPMQDPNSNYPPMDGIGGMVDMLMQFKFMKVLLLIIRQILVFMPVWLMHIID